MKITNELLKKEIDELKMKIMEVQLKSERALDVLEIVSKFMNNQVKMNSELIGIIKDLTQK